MDERRKVNYTLLCGVDRRHLKQLKWTWPTWKLHKPSLLDVPMVVFFDREQVPIGDVQAVVDHPQVSFVPWPPKGTQYVNGPDKWYACQRQKMLAGFVHVAARNVDTPWYLKLDTDVVATGMDNWIESSWFEDDPMIVCHPWGYTKPPYQMLLLDEWVQDCGKKLLALREMPPLHLKPGIGSEVLRHARIISWCGFFSTCLTRLASQVASDTCGEGHLPVPSQDGYLWYLATRLKLNVKRVHMKRRGWQHWSSDANVEKHAKIALGIE